MSTGMSDDQKVKQVKAAKTASPVRGPATKGGDAAPLSAKPSGVGTHDDGRTVGAAPSRGRSAWASGVMDLPYRAMLLAIWPLLWLWRVVVSLVRPRKRPHGRVLGAAVLFVLPLVAAAGLQMLGGASKALHEADIALVAEDPEHGLADAPRHLVRSRAHAGAVTAVAVSRDGAFVGTGGTDGWVRLWTRSGRLVGAVPAPSDHVVELAFIEDWTDGPNPTPRPVLMAMSEEGLLPLTSPPMRDDLLSRVERLVGSDGITSSPVFFLPGYAKGDVYLHFALIDTATGTVAELAEIFGAPYEDIVSVSHAARTQRRMQHRNKAGTHWTVTSPLVGTDTWSVYSDQGDAGSTAEIGIFGAGDGPALSSTGPVAGAPFDVVASRRVAEGSGQRSRLAVATREGKVLIWEDMRGTRSATGIRALTALSEDGTNAQIGPRLPLEVDARDPAVLISNRMGGLHSGLSLAYADVAFVRSGGEAGAPLLALPRRDTILLYDPATNSYVNRAASPDGTPSRIDGSRLEVDDTRVYLTTPDGYLLQAEQRELALGGALARVRMDPDGVGPSSAVEQVILPLDDDLAIWFTRGDRAADVLSDSREYRRNGGLDPEGARSAFDREATENVVFFSADAARNLGQLAMGYHLLGSTTAGWVRLFGGGRGRDIVREDRGAPFAVRFSPDLNTLAVAFRNNTMALYRRPVPAADGTDAPENGKGDGTTRTAGDTDLWDRVWSRDLPGNSWDVVFTPDGGHIAVSIENAGIEIVDPEDGQLLARLAHGDGSKPSGKQDFTDQIAISPDARFIALSGAGDNIGLWDLQRIIAGIETARNPGVPGDVVCQGCVAMHFLEGVTVTQDDGQSVLSPPGDTGAANVLLTVDGFGRVRLWDEGRGTPVIRDSDVWSYDLSEAPVATRLIRDPGEGGMADRLVLAHADGSVEVVDATSGTVMHGRTHLTPGPIAVLEVTADGRHLAVGDLHGSVRVVDLVRHRSVASFDVAYKVHEMVERMKGPGREPEPVGAATANTGGFSARSFPGGPLGDVAPTITPGPVPAN